MINSQAGWEISAAAVLSSLDNISLNSCDANQCSCKRVDYCCGVASWHRSFLEVADPAAAPVVALRQCAGCLVPRRGSAQAAGGVRRRLPVGNAVHAFLPGRPILARPLLPGLSGRPAQWAVTPGGDRFWPVPSKRVLPQLLPRQRIGRRGAVRSPVAGQGSLMRSNSSSPRPDTCGAVQR